MTPKIEMLYKPENVGKVYTTSRGNKVVQRKYHLTDKEIELLRSRHELETREVSLSIKQKAGSYFFNPYKKGLYWFQVQSLYLLGCNEWHEFKEVLNKIKELSSSSSCFIKTSQGERLSNYWEKFRRKVSREDVVKSKSLVGRIQENFLFMQRLSCHHPSGYKLMQAHASLDLKKESKVGFLKGILYYRLQIHSTQEESIPIRDMSNYFLNKYEKRYYSRKI